MKQSILPKCAILLVFVVIFLLFGQKLLRSPTHVDDKEPENPKQIQMDSFFHKISDFKVMYNMPGLQLYIYTSYLDQRFSQPVLRIFGIEKKDGIGVDFKCRWEELIEGDSSSKMTKEVTAQRYWIDTSWPESSPYHACEYNCAISKASTLKEVALVSSDMKYIIKVPLEMSNHYKSHKREEMALCIKPHSGYKGAARLVEWLETLQVVGYTKVIVYNSDITGPGRHILQYYQEKGLVTVIDFPYLIAVIQNVESPSLSAEERYAIYQQIYLVAMHDCLYRFSGLYRYIAFHDLDEVIIPTQSETITSMLRRAERFNPLSGGFLFRTIWHWEDFGVVGATEELYMQRYAKCTAANKEQPRSIVSTDRVITVNFQEILDVPKKDFKSVTLPATEYGAVHSYKGTCASKFKSDVCRKMLLEEVILDKLSTRYTQKIRDGVTHVMDHVKML